MLRVFMDRTWSHFSTMAPAAIQETFHKRDGLALEEVFDNIDAVNVLKANMQQEKGLYEASGIRHKRSSARLCAILEHSRTWGNPGQSIIIE
jgi:hypothetical protein